MSKTKFAMQADGEPAAGTLPVEGDPISSRPDVFAQGGESGGGPYPNPYTGRGGSPHGPDTFMGHGGQSEQAYYGHNQLGEKVYGPTANSPSRQGDELSSPAPAATQPNGDCRMSDISKGRRPPIVDEAQHDSRPAKDGWRPQGEEPNTGSGAGDSYTDEPAPPFRETERPATVGKTGNRDEDWAAARGSPATSD